MSKYEFHTTCIDSDGPSINVMVDQARDISFETFARHCNWRQVAVGLGYVVQGRGLYLSKDWAVSFHRSKYQGKSCYYFRWSAIEYIFTKETDDE